MNGAPDVAATSAEVRAVFEGGARGIDWMHLADAVDERRLLVPWPLMEPVLTSLISEHARSVVCGYFTREEALIRLVRGPYGPRLQQILIDTALAPDTQVRVDTLGAAGQRPTPEVITSMCDLLSDEREAVFRGAAWALECGFRQGGFAVPQLLPVLEQALAGLPEDRRATGFELLASLPPGIRRALGPTLGPPPAARGLAALPGPAQRAVASEVMTSVAGGSGHLAGPDARAAHPGSPVRSVLEQAAAGPVLDDGAVLRRRRR